jgi:nucleoside-diphosphate-sugar epimerase
MKILVTGATGFVGSHLCENLVDLGHELYVLVRSHKKAQEFATPGKLLLGDLSLVSIQKWSTELPGDLDCVIHTAGIVHAYDPADFDTINTQASINLFNELSQKIDQAHFIFVSSLAALGPSQRGTIATIDSPVSRYGHSKKQAELELSKLITMSSWRLNIVRPPMIIGPRDPAMLDLFQMIEGRILLYPGLDAGAKEYSFVCVYDLVSMITIMCEREDLEDQVLYCSYPQIVTYREITSLIAQQLNKKIFILPLPLMMIKSVSLLLKFLSFLLPIKARLTPDKVKEISAAAWTCDGSANQSQLIKMKYQWDLGSTIQETINDYRKRGWLKF